MANIITTLSLEMSANWYVTKKLNSIGRVGENTVTKLIIEPTEILDGVTYEIEIMSADGSKNVAELTVEGSELYLILTANMLTTSGITKMQVRGLFTDGSIKKSNIFELKVNRSISATEAYEEYAVTIFDQLVQDCRDIIEGAESYVVRAETAAVNAEAYEQSASTSAATASTAASNASASATSASTSASNAATSETNASASATNAATSETNAANSAASASTAASNASTSATNAANSATSAATSATNAHNSEVNASTSETNASTSATEAAASAESIAASVAQINENTYRINDLEAIIGGYTLTDLPTGAVATVTDGTALLMPSLKIGIEPQQEGSGDPSPENIRPISGWTAANIVVSPTTSAEDGTTYTIEFRDGDNPLTVYGGTLDVTSGELVVDRVKIDMGDLNYAYDTSYNRFVSSDIPNTEAPSGARITSFISSMYEVIDDSRPISQVTSGQMYSSFNNAQTNAIVMVHDNRFTDAALFKNAVTGQTFTYKLAEPITYQLTPTQIRTLVGNNNIWADTGNIIEGKYYKSLV